MAMTVIPQAEWMRSTGPVIKMMRVGWNNLRGVGGKSRAAAAQAVRRMQPCAKECVLHSPRSDKRGQQEGGVAFMQQRVFRE
jgi:hypothetical protein